jgi:hypothetical protein
MVPHPCTMHMSFFPYFWPDSPHCAYLYSFLASFPLNAQGTCILSFIFFLARIPLFCTSHLFIFSHFPGRIPPPPHPCKCLLSFFLDKFLLASHVLNIPFLPGHIPIFCTCLLSFQFLPGQISIFAHVFYLFPFLLTRFPVCQCFFFFPCFLARSPFFAHVFIFFLSSWSDSTSLHMSISFPFLPGQIPFPLHMSFIFSLLPGRILPFFTCLSSFPILPGQISPLCTCTYLTLSSWSHSPFCMCLLSFPLYLFPFFVAGFPLSAHVFYIFPFFLVAFPFFAHVYHIFSFFLA